MIKLFKVSIALALALSLTMLSACAGKPVNISRKGEITENTTTEYIGVDKAKAIALENAGIKEKDVKDLEVELDRERTAVVYEVSFDAQGYEYDYDIDAVSGDIVRTRREIDDAGRLPAATANDDTLTTEAPAETENVPETTTAATEPAKQTQPTTPTTVVEHSAEDYIGADRAKEIALSHAGLAEADVWDLKSELDMERGVVVYDVDFDGENYDYDYEIDAFNGDILRSDKERENNVRPAATNATTANSGNYIGEARAKEAALKHAGLSESDVWDLKAELDREHGTVVYDVSFETENYDYDYDIDAVSGEVVRSEKEPENNVRPTATSDSGNYIGTDRAKEIALDHAGLTANGVIKLKAEFDHDDHGYEHDHDHGNHEHCDAIYEVSFEANGYEYDYDIDAVSGDILHSEKERD